MTDDSKEHSHSANCEPISGSVIQKVAATVNKSPERLTPPLYEVVDPDALNRLFHDRHDEAVQAGGQITFTWVGCRVVVESTGDVEVSPLESGFRTARIEGQTVE